MLQYRLRTLMILLALGPPVFAGMIGLVERLVEYTIDLQNKEELLSHYGGGPTAVEHPYPELLYELERAKETAD